MAAQWAGVLDRFDDIPRYRQIDIIALYEIAWRMDAVNAHESRERARIAGKRGRRGGRR